MRRLLRLTLHPIFWMAAVQTAWTVTLILWIVSFARLARVANEGWGVLAAGVVFLVLVLAGVTIIVVHFGRQVAQNRAMKDFVSGVSHDLRSPLASVKLHLETLRLRALDDGQRQACLEAALHELGRLETGIEDVLTAARVDRRALSLTREVVDLGALVAGYGASKAPVVAARGGSLEVLAAKRVLAVTADATLLHKLLDNLVDNAVAHGPPGVRVRLAAREHGSCGVLSVTDDGPGLERAEWQKVFRMFYRGPRARQRHAKGTGLGLFLVAGIARAHGGRAWVESPGPGRGCCFQVALPLVRGPRAA